MIISFIPSPTPLHTPTHMYAYINNTRMRIRACVCVGAGEGMKEYRKRLYRQWATPVSARAGSSTGVTPRQYCRGAVTILGSETISYANAQHGLIEILDDIILHLQSYRKIVGSINLTA